MNCLSSCSKKTTWYTDATMDNGYTEHDVILSLDASTAMDEYDLEYEDILKALNEPDELDDSSYEETATLALSNSRNLILRYTIVDSLFMSQSHVYIEEITVQDK